MQLPIGGLALPDLFTPPAQESKRFMERLAGSADQSDGEKA